MNEIRSIEDALEASTAKDNLLDIIGGAADYSLEKLLDLGDGIPFISYLTKGVKATLGLRDFLFMEKVIEFLRKVGEEPTTKRREMINKILGDSKYSQKFGKVSLIALERFDDLKKATYFGHAAKYLARNEITFSLYKRISFTIDRMYISDLTRFAGNAHNDLPEYLKRELESFGLLKSSIVAKGSIVAKDNNSNLGSRGSSDLVNVSFKWETTRTGKAFKDILLERPLNYLGKREDVPLDFEESSMYSREW